MKLHSIRQKFLLTMMVTTATALIIASIISVSYNLDSFRENTVNDLSSQATLISNATIPALQFNDQQAGQAFLDLSDQNHQLRAVVLYDARGQQFARYSRTDMLDETVPSLPEADGVAIDDGVISVFHRIVANNEIWGTIYLQAEYKFYEKLLVNLAIACGGIALSLVFALLLSMWLQASVTRPILAVTRHAQEVVEQGNYSLRAAKTSHDEVGMLVDAFNAMLAEVENSQTVQADTNRQLLKEVEERRLAEQAQQASARQVLQLNAELEQRVKRRTLALENANNELEAFSYSVSHDLRSPLRAIDGFSQALLEDYQEQVDEFGQDYLRRVRAAAQRMGTLIDDMLKLSRVNRIEPKFEEVNISELVTAICAQLQDSNPDQEVAVQITSNLKIICDKQLVGIALQNLLSNAWKYSGKQAGPHIEFGMRHHDGEAVFFVQDNGVGFDMAYAGKLFGAFQRLHKAEDFPGTGVGLATVKRIISRHGGRIWAEAEVNKGATFYFTLVVSEITVEDKTRAEESSSEYQTNIIS